MAVAVKKVLVESSVLAQAAPVLLLWEAFRNRVYTVVQESNSVAGEAIWRVTQASGEPWRVRICGQFSGSSSLEFSFDPRKALVACQFGPAPRSDRWVFHIMPNGTTLRRAMTRYTIREAVDATLDHLVDA